MKIIQIDEDMGMTLIKSLNIDPKCSFCGKEIKGNTLGIIFGTPPKACCRDNTCMAKAYPKPKR